MDKRTWLVIAVTGAVFFGWQKFYVEPKAQQAQQSAVATAKQDAPSTIQAPVVKAQKKVEGPKLVSINTQSGKIVSTQSSAWFSGWKLDHYKDAITSDAKAIDLQSVTNFNDAIQVAFDSQEFSYIPGIQGSLLQNGNQATWSYDDSLVKITREMNPTETHVGVRLRAEFKGKKPNYMFVLLKSQLTEKDTEERDRLLALWTTDGIERVALNDTVEVKEFAAPVKWISAISHYFLLSIVNDSTITAKGLVQPLGGKAAQVALVFPVQGSVIDIPLKVYFGPKDLKSLRTFESTLDHAVDFGMFTIVAYPLLRVMNWFYQFTKNYGLAIIFLTILIKLLTYPLTYKSMKSMKEMSKLQPQIENVKKKYANDKEAMNREMMALMKNSGANPMMGCFPMLIQMPVFFALYQVLYNSVELYQTPFFFWIKDLSMKDPLYITPVLLTLMMWLQQKLTPSTSADPMQQKMMQFMPVMFGVFMITLPSGLTLYMLTNSVVSIIQQIILNKKLGPTTPQLAKASAGAK